MIAIQNMNYYVWLYALIFLGETGLVEHLIVVQISWLLHVVTYQFKSLFVWGFFFNNFTIILLHYFL